MGLGVCRRGEGCRLPSELSGTLSRRSALGELIRQQA